MKACSQIGYHGWFADGLRPLTYPANSAALHFHIAETVPAVRRLSRQMVGAGGSRLTDGFTLNITRCLMPRWLAYCLISMLIWATWSLLSPIASRDLSGSMAQVLSSVGLIPCVLLLLFSKNLKKATHFGKGLALATATGLMGGAGNIMIYKAIQSNGPVSLVFPISCMAPLIPILAAPVLFKEKILRIQAFGIGLSLVAIFLLNSAPAPSATTTHVTFFSDWMVYTLLSLVLFGLTFITQKGATYFISCELSTIAFAAGFFPGCHRVSDRLLPELEHPCHIGLGEYFYRRPDGSRKPDTVCRLS
jgi:uncharacterized membrane protein